MLMYEYIFRGVRYLLFAKQNKFLMNVSSRYRTKKESSITGYLLQRICYAFGQLHVTECRYENYEVNILYLRVGIEMSLFFNDFSFFCFSNY